MNSKSKTRKQRQIATQTEGEREYCINSDSEWETKWERENENYKTMQKNRKKLDKKREKKRKGEIKM